jgi:hypothetical protein
MCEGLYVWFMWYVQSTVIMCPVENKSSGAVSVYIADELRADLEEYAAAQDRSVSWVIRKAIAGYLAANGKPKEQAA